MKVIVVILLLSYLLPIILTNKLKRFAKEHTSSLEEPEQCCVTLYKITNPHWTDSKTICHDAQFLSTDWENEVAELSISPGCEVTVYEGANWNGHSLTLGGPGIMFLGSICISGNENPCRLWSKVVRSFKLERISKDPTYSLNDSAECCVTFWDYFHRDSNKISWCGGDVEALGHYWGSKIEHLKTSPWCDITIYTEEFWTGKSLTLKGNSVKKLNSYFVNVHDIKNLDIIPSWIGQVRSFKLKKTSSKCCVSVYTEDFGSNGKWCDDIYNVGDRWTGKISSFRLDPGCKITVFQDANYGGYSKIFSEGYTALKDVCMYWHWFLGLFGCTNWDKEITSFKLHFI